MENLASKVLQASNGRPLPLVQQPRARDQHIRFILNDDRRVNIEPVKPDSPLGSRLIPGSLDTLMVQTGMLSDTVLICHPLPVLEDLWSTGKKVLPLWPRLEAQLVGMRGHVFLC